LLAHLWLKYIYSLCSSHPAKQQTCNTGL